MLSVRYTYVNKQLYGIDNNVFPVIDITSAVFYSRRRMPIKVHLSKILGEKRLKMTQLEKHSGISRQAIFKLFHEKSKGVEFETLAKLCQALNCSVGDLLEYVPDNQQ
jgi:putative transcriptional regulator